MKTIRTLSKSYDLKGLKGKLLLCDPDSVPLTPPELYIRSGVDHDWVMRLEALIEEGAELDPVIVAYVEELEKEVLVGGNHRVEAHRGLMSPEIKVLHIGKISLEEFFKLQRELNPDILPMDTEELKRYAEKLYDHLKSKYEKKELYEKIAQAVGRSSETVRKWLADKEQEEKQAKVRRAIELREKGYTQEQIAEELGVSERTIRNWLSEAEKMGDITKISSLTLLTDHTPTPEGLKLWGEYVLNAQNLSDAYHEMAFEEFIKEKGYQTENIRDFLIQIRKQITSYITNLANAGASESAIKTALAKEKAGIFAHISTPAKTKLANLLKDTIADIIKETHQRQEEEAQILSIAEEIIQDPEYTFSNWTDLAIKVRERRGDDLPTKGSGQTQDIADLLKKHSDHLLQLYNQTPEVPEEKVREILKDHDLDEFESLEQLKETIKASVLQEGYRWTNKAEWIITEAHNNHIKETSLLSPEPSAGTPPALSEEEESPFDDIEAFLKKADEAWDKMHAQEELPTEKKTRDIDKTSVNPRGRPPKEKFFDKERELEDLKNRMKEAMWLIINKFGWEAAGKALDEVVEEFREYAPEGLV